MTVNRSQKHILPLRSEKVIAPGFLRQIKWLLKVMEKRKGLRQGATKRDRPKEKERQKDRQEWKTASQPVNKPAGWGSSYYQSASIFVFFSTVQNQLYLHRTESSHCLGTQRHVNSLTKLLNFHLIPWAHETTSSHWFTHFNVDVDGLTLGWGLTSPLLLCNK